MCISPRRTHGKKRITETAMATITASGSRKASGGVMPSRMSRMMPPPTAVVTPRTITPSRSIFLCMAVNAPETAKATVPII